MLQKVMAYIVRRDGPHPELLVFQHRHSLEAGLQVPAGTVEPGEAVEAALLREIEEEAGLTGEHVRLVRRLAIASELDGAQLRHVYEVAAAALPQRWAHTVRGRGEDKDLLFEYAWVALAACPPLAGGQGRFLHWLAAPGVADGERS